MNVTYEVNFPPSIISTDAKTKVTLVMTTHRTSPDNKPDSLVFKNLVNDIEKKLKDKGELKDFEKLITKLREIQNDTYFWTHNKDGLAILATPNEMSIYQLNRNLEENVSVGSLFYIKPLVRNFQSDDEYYLLGLGKDSFEVFEGNRYGFGKIEFPPELPTTAEEVLGGPDEVNASYDPRLRNHQSVRDRERIDLSRFYQYVRSFIDKNLKVSVHKPLILIGTSDQIGIFKSIDKTDDILDKAIIQSTDSLFHNIDILDGLVWEILEPHFLEKTQSLENKYREMRDKDLSSSDIADIITALKEGRVRTLVVESGRQVPNDYDSLKDYDEGEDALSILTNIALQENAEVVVLPKERMPDDTGAFALFRF